MTKRKPTKRDLISAIDSLQGLVGLASGASGDRNPHRAAHLADYFARAQELCIEVRGQFDVSYGEGGRWQGRDAKSTAM